MTDQDKRLWVAALALFVLLGLFRYRRPQGNNQVVRPSPEGAAAPVAPQPPDIVAELRSAKSYYEGLARSAQAVARERKLPAGKLAVGRDLYTQLQAELDGCVTSLQAALPRRFERDDAGGISQRLAAAGKKGQQFRAWCERLKPPAGDAGTDWLAAAATALDRLVERIKDQDDRAVEQLRADLEACRLRDWADLKE
jgi:hypothetical protein